MREWCSAAALVLMMLVEDIASRVQQRRSEIGAVLLAGSLGIAYFIGILYAAGEF